MNGFKYNLPNKGPGRWHNMTPNQKPVVCRTGYHITRDPMRWHRYNTDRVFEVEFRGKVAYEGRFSDKIACSSIRLIKELAVEKNRDGKTIRRFTVAELAKHMKILKLVEIHRQFQAEYNTKTQKLHNTYAYSISSERTKAIKALASVYRKKAKAKGLTNWPKSPAPRTLMVRPRNKNGSR